MAARVEDESDVPAVRLERLRDGDVITIDLPGRSLTLNLDAVELAGRMAQLPPPPARAAGGVMGKYSRLVSSAAQGAVTA